ncbi:MAG: hypothetical protein WC444_05555 [Candidatus Paceibacterota bacterium]
MKVLITYLGYGIESIEIRADYFHRLGGSYSKTITCEATEEQYNELKKRTDIKIEKISEQDKQDKQDKYETKKPVKETEEKVAEEREEKTNSKNKTR